MGRVLVYKGAPESVENLLYHSNSSFIHQAQRSTLDMAGYGVAVWDPESHNPKDPFLYKSTGLPLFDRNLSGISKKLKASALLMHLRGVSLEERASINEGNVHPFQYPGYSLLMAHDGGLARFSEMKFDLVEHIRPEIRANILGSTDSEWIYALLMSQFENPAAPQAMPQILGALERTYAILRKVRRQKGISTTSVANLFLVDGENLVATRYAFDFGCYDIAAPAVNARDTSYKSLWYTSGKRYGKHENEWKMLGGSQSTDSVLIASEPLTQDTSSWLEVPEYCALYVVREDDTHRLGIHPITA